MTGSYDAFTAEQLAAWDPEGDLGRRLLLNPAIFRMLGDVAARRILDAGCGQGYLCRLLAGRGASVVGLEPSSTMLDYALARERDQGQGIVYLRGRLDQPPALSGPFDAVVANMVLLDIDDWRAAMNACIEHLAPGGDFIFSLLHPCWAVDAMATWREHGSVRLREYLQEYKVDGQYCPNYHRPLSSYLNHALSKSCRLIELAEPAPPNQIELPDEAEIVRHIPNFVVIHFQRA